MLPDTRTQFLHLQRLDYCLLFLFALNLFLTELILFVI